MADAKSPVQLGYHQVQRETAKLLRPIGFRRKGSMIFTRTEDNFGVIHFQRNPYSTKDELVFTLNVGVIIGKLLDSRAYAKYPSIVHAQVRERIGFLLPERYDKWWTITEEVDIFESSKDFAQLVLEKAVPFVQQFMKMENVVCAWEQGNALGLTERKRVEYLARLRTLFPSG